LQYLFKFVDVGGPPLSPGIQYFQTQSTTGYNYRFAQWEIKQRLDEFAFNATFNNISVLVQRSVLLEEETEENHRPVESH
jgi:hypothetical protein